MSGVIINSGKPYQGFRKAIDASNFILDPVVLFNRYKTRVLGDGGKIIDESKLLKEITEMVQEGLWENSSTWISASFGVKVNSANEVLKVYGLGNSPDFVPKAFGSTVRPVLLDLSQSVPLLMVNLNNGGSILQSEKTIRAQRSAGNNFTLSVRGVDALPYPTDSIGMNLNFASTGTNTPLNWRVFDGLNTRLQWSYGTSSTVPISTGSQVFVEKTPYAPLIKTSAIINPNSGTISVYENGVLSSSKVHSSGKLADLNNTDLQVNIGPQFNNPETWGTGSLCYGGISSLRLLSASTIEQAIFMSSLD